MNLFEDPEANHLALVVSITLVISAAVIVGVMLLLSTAQPVHWTSALGAGFSVAAISLSLRALVGGRDPS